MKVQEPERARSPIGKKEKGKGGGPRSARKIMGEVCDAPAGFRFRLVLAGEMGEYVGYFSGDLIRTRFMKIFG